MSTIEQDLHLSEDLILEILSRLPPITLVRFKSVSKTWYSLISNPDFCRRNTALYQFHRSNSHGCRNHIHDDHHMLEEPSPPGILLRRGFCVGDSNIVIYPRPRRLGHDEPKNLALLVQNLNDYRPAFNESSVVPLKNETFTLSDSCNGLLLYVHNSRVIRKEVKEGEEEEEEEVFRTCYVCNPITKDYIKLPTIDPQLHMNTFAVKIVFNPSFTLTYKVFTWISTSSNNYRLYVYSSEARSWRLSVSIPIAEFPLNVYGGLKAVLWNGVLHWTSLHWYSFVGGRLSTDDALSLCYDIEKETVWTMKFPKMATGGYTHRRLLYFGLCGERLLLIQKQYNHEDGLKNGFPSSFDVLEKQEQNGDDNEDMWTVRYRVNFEEVDNYNFYSEVIGTGSNTIFSASIFDIYRTMRTKNGEVVEEEVMLMKVGSTGNYDWKHWIIFFNLTSNTFGNKKLLNRSKTMLPNMGFLNYTDILQYNVTLFPPCF